MILLVDNYDSFVFNIDHSLRSLGEATLVRRNDAIGLDEVAALCPSAIVLSPGPCAPAQAGLSLPLVRRFSRQVPILGVCLGHQCIGEAFGARVVRARRPMHGRTSELAHRGDGLFEGLPNPVRVGRYHSLIVAPGPAADPRLMVTARSEEGEVMALALADRPTYGVQFHPESILTEAGPHLLANFLRLARAWQAARRGAHALA